MLSEAKDGSFLGWILIAALSTHEVPPHDHHHHKHQNGRQVPNPPVPHQVAQHVEKGRQYGDPNAQQNLPCLIGNPHAASPSPVLPSEYC